MKIPRIFRAPIVQAVMYLPVTEVAKMIYVDLRDAGVWEKLNALACGSAILLMAFFTPKRHAPTGKRVPWEQLSELDKQVSAFSVCLLLFMFGGMFYMLKLRQRFVYGLLEIAFAMIAGWKWYQPQGRPLHLIIESGNLSDAVAAATVIYVVVRGLDNCSEYIKANRAKRLPA